MSRTPEEVLTALATAAGQVAFDRTRTWRDALFEESGALSRPGDPDRALLAALAAEYPQLDAHGDTLAGRLHVDWLERILGVPRLPAVPDTVVAHATVDPALAPAVLPPGTVLRGGKDAFGAERRYATADALTAHGATVVAVRSLVPGGHETGLPGLVAEGPPFPLAPGAGEPAPHVLRLYSPALAFREGGLGLRLTFAGAGSLAGLAPGQWRYPRPDGTFGETTTGTISGATVRVQLLTACGLPEGTPGDPWLEVAIPHGAALPTGLSFTNVELEVIERSWIVPQAAYLNDGAVDVTKECQPFGAAAKRGDAFYLRSDEALGKKLASLSIAIETLSGGTVLPSAAGGVSDYVSNQVQYQIYYLQTEFGSEVTAGAQTAFENLQDLVATAATPKVVWQRRQGGEWQLLKDVGATLTGFSGVSASGAVASEPVEIGGERGHYIRAFLAEGDFGWTKYQADIATFATETVKGNEPIMPVPPTPPVVSSVRLSYTTAKVAASRIETRNGWARVVRTGSGSFAPFTRLVSDAGHTGMVALGLEVPDSVTGSSISVWLGVESAAPCGSSTAPTGARWEWWDGAAWQELAVADGTRLLRESGILRFVAPAGWAVGCPAADAETGRWVRLVTAAPERIGVLTSVTPDAVLATFVSAAADPATDPSSATALPPGTIKGTLAPVPGVKKLTNLVGVRGRAPEDDDAYRRRASGQARHRGRAVTSWDFEELVAVAFPEVAAVRCLPHTGPGGVTAPGGVGLVVLPDRPTDPAPRPSVSLSGRITDLLAPMTAMHATPTVLCPLYVPVTVAAVITLRRGVAALIGLDAVTVALEAWLHPGTERPTRWGRSLYASSLAAFLDGLPEVDTVESLAMAGPSGVATELIEVDVCRGLFCSSGAHSLDVEEQL